MKDELIYQDFVMYGLFLGCDEKKSWGYSVWVCK